MFKLQLKVVGHWTNVNDELKAKLPEDCDVLAWVRKQWPASEWRIAWVREEN